jgi:hypothetical protein
MKLQTMIHFHNFHNSQKLQQIMPTPMKRTQINLVISMILQIYNSQKKRKSHLTTMIKKYKNKISILWTLIQIPKKHP